MSTHRRMQMGRGLPVDRPTEPAPTTTPPIDFPVYELDDFWTGTRQVTGVAGRADGDADGDADGIELTHADTDGERFIVIGTFQCDPYNARVQQRFNDPREALAQDALRLLATSPPDAADPRTTTRPVPTREEAARLIREHAEWPRASWMFEEHDVTAAYTEASGGWIGFTDSLPNLYVIAAASHTPLSEISLRPVNTDGANRYRLTLTNPYRVDSGNPS